jgi:hypothetical protein
VPPRTRKPGTPKIPFVLNEERFRKLTALIQELTGAETLEYTVRLSDGSYTTYSSADEVLSIPNSRERQIKSIWIESPYSNELRIEVKFQSETYLEPIEYTVSGVEKDVFHASARLDEYFSGLRQWYAPVSGGGNRNFVIPMNFALVLAFTVPRWLAEAITTPATPSAEELTLVLLLSVVASPVGMYLGSRLRRWLFPNGTFATGDGIDRHSYRVRMRRLVGGGVILALIISILSN